MSGSKILTVGSAFGSIRDLFSKIKAIDTKHGPFDLILCTGDFFGPPKDGESDGDDEVSQLLDGKLEVPNECYIMQGEHALPEKVIEKFAKTSGQLCERVFLLSKSSTVTTAQGLRIACLGGTYDPDTYLTAEAAPGFLSPQFSKHTVERLLANCLTKAPAQQNYNSLASVQSTSAPSQLIDIFLSNVWPQAITQHSSVPLPDPVLSSIGVPPLDDVIKRIKPRYHFAAGGGQPPRFWEREPFIWDDEEGRVSRFVSLGAFGSEPVSGKKQRWFYAFSVAPNTSPAAPILRPSNATKNPLLEGVMSRHAKRTMESSESENFIFGNVQQPAKRTRIVEGRSGKPPPGYKCRRCESTDHYITDCPERLQPPDGYICKICNVPGHLVRDCPTRNAVGDTGGRKPKPGYMCRACGSEGHYLEDCLVANERPNYDVGGNRKRGPLKEIAPDECWFCLSNPNLAKHLIVSIGTECYVTLPKGQLIPTQSAAERVDVPGGGHVLVVPITHYPTYSTIPPDLAPAIVEETRKYKSALRAFFAKHGSAATFFELGRLSTRGGHAHVQAVPVPQGLRDHVEDAFRQHGRERGVEFEVAEDGVGAVEGGYFRVDLPDGRVMVASMGEGAQIGVQLGREVLASLLNMPDRVDWRACTLSNEEDRADAQAFKAAFAAFDPSM